MSNGQQHPSGDQILRSLQSVKQREALRANYVQERITTLEMFAQQDKATICAMASRFMARGDSINDAVTKAFDLFEGIEAEWTRRGEAERAKSDASP
jgi:hypothetical protein